MLDYVGNLLYFQQFQVFSDAEETQVPQLRDYVHTVTRESKKQAMDFLISSLSRLVSDVQNVMTNSSMKV